MDDAESDYVIEAVHFIARHGYRFLCLYDFDLCSGTWSHKHDNDELQNFSLDAALEANALDPAVLTDPLRKQLYDHYMTEANRWVERLKEEPDQPLARLEGELGELQFFALPGNSSQPH